MITFRRVGGEGGVGMQFDRLFWKASDCPVKKDPTSSERRILPSPTKQM